MTGDTDERRLARTYDAYGGRLYRYALVLLQRPRDAEDAVQNVFVRLAAGNGRLAQIGDPEAYLFRAIRNEAASCLRRRRRLASREVDIDDADGLVARSGPADGDERRAVARALARLRPDQREVVGLHAFEGLTFAEIGALLGKSPHTVASRYRLAIARLASWLGGR